jgi:hypothetical protein
MEAEAPVDDAQIGVRVALHGKSAQQHQPATVFELVAHLGQRASKPRDLKVVASHCAPVEAAALHPLQRGVHLLDVSIRDGPDPIDRASKVLPAPGRGTKDRRRRHRIHGHLSFDRRCALIGPLRRVGVTRGSILRPRDEWVRGAYKPGTKEFLARVNLAS